ncbi:MAG TPA: hypothetical protein VM692_04015 [Gammaproteobacteria bacterium]|nr:hypothetical protein [Gammaproteobacteria bacterium]
MKRQLCARRIGVCLIFGCACVIQAWRVQGQAQWETVPDIKLQAESNDNPTLDSGFGVTPGTPSPIDSANRVLADAAIRFRRANPRGELMLEPRVRRDAYANEEAQPLESTDVFFRSSGLKNGQTTRVGYSADLARERIIGLEFLETLDPVDDDPTAVATNQVGANELRTRIGVAPYVDIELNSRTLLRLDGRIVDVDYNSGATAGRTDFLERAIGGEYRKQLSDQRGSLGVHVFATGYEAALNNNTTDTRGIELIFGRELSELWTWNVSGGTQRSDYALSAGGRRIRGTDSSAIFGVGLSKRAEVSTMRVDVRRTMSPDSLGFVAPRDEFRVAWQRMLSAKINGRIVVRAIDAEGIPTVANSERLYGRAELDVEWQFSPTWWITAGYAHSTAQRDVVVNNVTVSNSSDSNALTVGLRYRGKSTQRQPGDLAR